MKNESSYQFAINIFKFPDDVRLVSLKSHFIVCLECQVTVLSKQNFKKRVCKSLFQKKYLFNSWIRTRDLLNANQLHYILSHTAVVFNGMLLELSPLLHLQPAAERNLITALTRGDKRG